MSTALPSRVAACDPRPTTASWTPALAREVKSLAAGAGVLALVWASARHGALPAAAASAAFLAACAWWDVRSLRIPNALIAPAFAAPLLFAGLSGGVGAAGAALAAALAALALLLGPFAWGWLGAGDVKALAVLAGLWGLEVFLPALGWMLVVGGAGALLVLAARGELPDLLRRWGRSLWLSLASRRLHYVGPQPGSAARAGLPFALAMGLGSAAYGFWGAPW